MKFQVLISPRSLSNIWCSACNSLTPETFKTDNVFPALKVRSLRDLGKSNKLLLISQLHLALQIPVSNLELQ